jgi:hypothetical protein
LRRSLEQFIRLLDQHRLLPADTAANRRAAFAAIVESLGIPADLETPAADRKKQATETPPPTIRSVDTVGGQFVRVWLGRVDADLLPALEGSLGDDVMHGHYEGVALDLRGAVGNVAGSMAPEAEFFRKLDLPLAILIDERTAGAAERLVIALKKTTNAVTLGRATRGVPFEMAIAQLPGGEKLLLPKDAGGRESRAETKRRKPVIPDVETDTALPEPEKNAKTSTAPSPPLWAPDVLEGDACLRRAVDLLSTIRAMGG